METLPLINLLLIWTMFGSICAYLAKKNGKPPLIWFFTGLILGIFGVILFYILPKNSPQPKKAAPRPRPRSDAWLKMWYYLDPKNNQQKGPIEFPDLADNWKKKILKDETLIWGEGMKEWKQLSDLPEVKEEFQNN